MAANLRDERSLTDTGGPGLLYLDPAAKLLRCGTEDRNHGTRDVTVLSGKHLCRRAANRSRVQVSSLVWLKTCTIARAEPMGKTRVSTSSPVTGVMTRAPSSMRSRRVSRVFGPRITWSDVSAAKDVYWYWNRVDPWPPIG